ncbi:hypothetical protein M413DRAFT_442337 [Hebeloma cylindrosporum]|uniref:Uncharacterized protein n=1 Tax=Hebeloma cylindrosporum TaxID=76867 RepID=A0A0C3CA68_HEBCY|nr:hypothetical protein M413DRAFT_442337 [Hebeloma cylindrosporum h7]
MCGLFYLFGWGFMLFIGTAFRFHSLSLRFGLSKMFLMMLRSFAEGQFFSVHGHHLGRVL